MKETEDDDARDAEDEHERALTDEPFADFALRFFQGAFEAQAMGFREEGEEEAIGVLALEHEVDAEEGGGEDVEEVGEPEGDVGEEIGGGGVECSDGALGDGVDAEAIDEGNLPEFGGDIRDSLRELVGEVAEVAHDRGKAGGEEEGEDTGDADDENNDGDGP